jgi:hypothetical protein
MTDKGAATNHNAKRRVPVDLLNVRISTMSERMRAVGRWFKCSAVSDQKWLAESRGGLSP